MMNEKQFIESQKDCAKMLGISLKEYKEYCKNLKVSTDTKVSKKNKTLEILNLLNIDKNKLKKEND